MLLSRITSTKDSQIYENVVIACDRMKGAVYEFN